MELIKRAAAESRHELVLNSAEAAKEIKEKGLDESVFQIQTLNFLEISKVGLSHLSDNVGNLLNLTSLVLRNNSLTVVPESFGNLSKLKLLDLSFNSLDKLGSFISKLTQLQSLLVGSNVISSLPSLKDLSNLHVLDASHNKLESFPDGINGTHMPCLLDLNLAGNKLKAIPEDICSIPTLRLVDVSENELNEIPATIGTCGKLRDFRFNDNKLKDKRLVKMGLQCQTKAVLEYLANQMPKGQKSSKGGAKDKKQQKGNASGKDDTVDEVTKNLMTVLHFHDDGLCITATDSVINVRPYLVACIVKNVNFEKNKNSFRQFLAIQTQLHDTLCDKRQLATIATHDLSAVRGPLVYNARIPSDIEIKPLGRNTMSAEDLVNLLWQEAEEFRKVKKRNTVSGIHKYLELIRSKDKYPVLVDKNNVVISLPPLTNSELTKMSAEKTHDLLLEVTGDSSLDLCKSVMDTLLQRMLELDLGDSDTTASGDTSDGGHKRLTIEQVRIIDERGQLRVVYPSRTDLQSDAFSTVIADN